MPIRRTIAAKETWFNQDGNKQLEKLYKIYKDGNFFVIADTHHILMYDNIGRVIKEHHIFHRSQKKVQDLIVDNPDFWMKNSVFRWE